MNMTPDVKQRNPSLLGLLMPDKARVDAQCHSRFYAGEDIFQRINKHDFFNLVCRLRPSGRSPSAHMRSGSRQSDRLPPEMTPVTEGSAANLQASFCLNSSSPCRQSLVSSVTASPASPPWLFLQPISSVRTLKVF